MQKTLNLLLPLFLMNSPTAAADRYEKATFAGGCFWCMESPFELSDGIIEVIAGYTGGKISNPSYAAVSTGRTGHAEAVQITFDPQKISYGDLLNIYWRQIDPTDSGGQFVDRGNQYRPAIFYHNENQRRQAENALQQLERSGRFNKPLSVEIMPATEFYAAEDYHQNYHRKNPVRYKIYRSNSGRDRFIASHWQDKTAKWNRPPDKQLKEILTPLQYRVTRRNGTEPPFDNEYWDNKREGLYVDVVSGQPLFSTRPSPCWVRWQ